MGEEEWTLGLIETEEPANSSEHILTVGRAVSQNSPNGPELTCSGYWVVTQHAVTQEQPTHRGVSSAASLRDLLEELFWNLADFIPAAAGQTGGEAHSDLVLTIALFPLQVVKNLNSTHAKLAFTSEEHIYSSERNYFCINPESGDKRTFRSEPAKVRAVLVQKCLSVQTRQMEDDENSKTCEPPAYTLEHWVFIRRLLCLINSNLGVISVISLTVRTKKEILFPYLFPAIFLKALFVYQVNAACFQPSQKKV